MKLFHEQIDFPASDTIKVKWDDFPHFTYPWHFHTEFEIVYIIKSYGTRYVADSIEAFQAGDLVLTGSNLPHFWKSDEAFHQNNPEYKVQAIVVQFPNDFFSEQILKYPEFSSIQKMLKVAGGGIKFLSPTSDSAGKLIKQILKDKGFEKILRFLKLLNLLSKSNNFKILASEVYQPDKHQFTDNRLSKAIHYINLNYTQKISLKNVAEIVGLHPSAFCRFFKEKTGKSFSNYVNDMRIGYACKLLIEGSMTVSQICFESGFNNISNFNRTFKRKTGMSPVQYQKQIHNDNLPLVETFEEDR